MCEICKKLQEDRVTLDEYQKESGGKPVRVEVQLRSDGERRLLFFKAQVNDVFATSAVLIRHCPMCGEVLK